MRHGYTWDENKNGEPINVIEGYFCDKVEVGYEWHSEKKDKWFRVVDIYPHSSPDGFYSHFCEVKEFAKE